jgi:hypothetical protein
MNITTAEFVKILKRHSNQFFAIDFHKKDGSLRHMVGRLGVVKYVKGTGRPYKNVDPNNYLTVWDSVVKNYRSVIISTVFAAKIAGTEYKIIKEV